MTTPPGRGVKFHELGWPHVYNADKLFEAIPRADDGMHFVFTNETYANIEAIVSAVIRHASTLLPWDWLKIQCKRLGKVIPSVEVTNLEKLGESEEEEQDKGTVTPKADEEEGAMPKAGAKKDVTPKAKKQRALSKELDEPPSPCSEPSEVDYDPDKEASSEEEVKRDASPDEDDDVSGSEQPVAGRRHLASDRAESIADSERDVPAPQAQADALAEVLASRQRAEQRRKGPRLPPVAEDAAAKIGRAHV